ncbi:MAG TPA: divalent-cation tolerance protein CutA [bacterium]|nr:divalent-cation tolerance protein CutA [bacterium]
MSTFPHIVVFSTASGGDEAERIARTLVEEKLAACVNVLPGIRSIYRWEDRVQQDDELLIVIKTTESRFPAVCDRIRDLHGYEVPEIVALPIIRGSEEYMDWISASVR